ncbi:hypothetical protein H0H93_006067 [Arthromyces matolae]|nr:hypothetical protein H0H93_006067 [Arthromyces matolae]
MGVAVLKFLGSLTATVVVYGAYRVLKIVYREVASPLRDLPGPENPSFVYGNMKELSVARRRLVTSDTKAINHILMNTQIYEKAPAARYNLGRLLGNGVLVVEGEKHKHQRKVMNPAFGPTQVRELTAIFVNKAIELRDVWLAEIERQGSEAHVDGLSWLSRATLDIIGLAGFKYKFDALTESPEKNELNAAFATMFQGGTKVTMIPMLRTYIPALRFLKTDQDVRAAEAKKTMSRIGQELLQESKQSIHEKVEQRDLLTLMVKSNMAVDLPEHQRMSDQDVLAQVPTFLVAGHETTSTATTWTLYALTQNKVAQEELRRELLTVDTDTPTMEQLNALPYLDMVVRESMRLHSPVPNTMRTAVQNDVIPLAKPFVDRNGVSHNAIK